MDKEGVSARKSVFALISEIWMHAGALFSRLCTNGKWEGHAFMLHVTCDLCGKTLCPGQDQRFVVKMEVFAAHDPGKITEADLDDDHMEAVSELLRESEDNPDDPDLAEPVYKHFRYDLCPECHKRFLRDPLSRDSAQKFDFSKN
jgi:hypothetical protein